MSEIVSAFLEALPFMVDNLLVIEAGLCFIGAQGRPRSVANQREGAVYIASFWVAQKQGPFRFVACWRLRGSTSNKERTVAFSR
jgi:hypothetical protein